MSNKQPRRSYSPASRRSKSPSSSSRSFSRSSDKTSSRSRSPRRSRSRERRSSPSYRRSVSPLSRRRRYSPPRSRSPAAPSSSRRSNSPYRRSPSPRTLAWSARRMSPPRHTRGHKRTRSPPADKRPHGRHHSEDPDHSATTRPASGRIHYPSQPGPMGRYNSRLSGAWGGGGGNTEQRKMEWTCSKCSEIFFEQRLYVEHVRERNLKMKCPGRGELLVLDDSPPAAVKKERRLASKKFGPPAEVILDDSPPCIALDVSDEATTLPSNSVASASELPAIVPPLDQSSLCLEPISDQSLPTSPVNTSAPTSLPVGLSLEISSALTGSSPPRMPQEMLQSRAKLREDGVLMFDEVAVQAKKVIKFKKNLFKVLPDLLDIEPEVQPGPAKVDTEDPTMSPACEGLVLTKSLESANSLLQSLPNNPHPIPVVDGSEPKRKLPKCLREDDEIEEPALVSKVKAPKPVDEMELLLDKRIRKQFIQKKAISKEDLPEVTMKSTELNQRTARPCKPIQKLDSDLKVNSSSSVTKKKKSGKKRRIKERKKKMENLLQKEAANVPTVPSSSSPFVESKSSLSEASSQGLAPNKPVIPSYPVLEHAILSPVSSCSFSVSPTLPSSASSVPSSSQLPSASASHSVAVLPSSILSNISTPATTTLSASTSSTTNSHSPSTITTTSLISTSSSALVSTTPHSPMPAEVTPTSSLSEDLSPQNSSTSVRSDSMTDSFTTKASGGVFTVAWQLGSPPRASPPAFTETVSTKHSPPSSPIYGGEVMSLYQALGGSPSEDDQEEIPQPVILRAGVDSMDKCPDCKAKLETGSNALNFSLNMTDLSILVDCVQCGVRVRLKGVLGARQRAVLGCGM